MVNSQVDGRVYASSFDYDREILDKIVSFAPVTQQDDIYSKLERVKTYPYNVDLDPHFLVNVEAVCGQMQRGQYEYFIPLIVVGVE